MTRRHISFGNSTIALDYDGARAARIVTTLYQYVPDLATDAPHITLRLIEDAADGHLRVYAGETLTFQSDSDGAVAEYLLGQSCYHLADRSHGGLLFHAAGVQWQEQGMILPGQTGAGKTTLTAWLLTQGYQYLTDELVFVPDQSLEFEAFPRPLNIKQGARTLLRQMLANEPPPPPNLSSGENVLIPPESLSRQAILRRSPLDRIIFPRYAPDAAFACERLSKAHTGFALMRCFVNARNLTDHGFSEITRLAEVIPAYRLTYADFAQIERAQVFQQPGED